VSIALIEDGVVTLAVDEAADPRRGVLGVLIRDR
jgi:hypothetical protein